MSPNFHPGIAADTVTPSDYGDGKSLPPSEYYARDSYEIVHHGGIGVGAERNLSGSCHELIVRTGEEVKRILIDMGAYQGGGSIDRSMLNIVNGANAVILTHPHMDHIGEALAAISKHIVNPELILATPGTKFAMEIALNDAIKIEETRREGVMRQKKQIADKILKPAIKFLQESTGGIKRDKSGNKLISSNDEGSKKAQITSALELLAKHGVERNDTNWYKKFTDVPEPLYTSEDVTELIERTETLDLHEGWREIAEGVSVKFYNAGHILGSISALFRIEGREKTVYVLFSGDLGSYKWDIHPNGISLPPEDIKIDTIVTESTYGGRDRAPFAQDLATYEATLAADLVKHNHVIHACFSMDRFQNMLHRVIDMKKRGIIPQDVVIIADSVMGNKYTLPHAHQAKRTSDKNMPKAGSPIRKILSPDFEQTQKEGLKRYSENIDPKNGEYLIATHENREELMALPGKKIIITSSGMMEGGPIIWYLAQYLSDPKSVFYSPGFLVEETKGDLLAKASKASGIQTLAVDEEHPAVEIRATIRHIAGFSGHGDETDIVTWIDAIEKDENTKVVIVHGNKNTGSMALKDRLEKDLGISEKNLFVPDLGVSISEQI